MANNSDTTLPGQTYPGGKARLHQWLINRIPPHSVFVSTHLGNCAVMRYKRPAKLNIGIDLDPAVDLLERQAILAAIQEAASC